MLSERFWETPCADPHAGCCGGWGLDTPGYPIRCLVVNFDYKNTVNIKINKTSPAKALLGFKKCTNLANNTGAATHPNVITVIRLENAQLKT